MIEGRTVARRARIVGRTAERAALRRELRQAPPSLRVVAIQGQPGMGKTTLWLDAVATARRRGFVVLDAAPAEAESRASYRVLADLLADPEPAVGAAVANLPDAHRLALAAAISGAAVPLTGSWQVVAAALLGLLRSLTASGPPTLIAIDDIQWADRPTMRILEFALRRLRDRSLLVLASERVAFRSSGEGTTLAELDVDAIRVGPMSATELGLLLAARIGAVPAAWLERLHAESGGNPFIALEMARAAGTHDELTRAPAPVTRLAISNRLRRLARDHVAALDDDGLRVAVVAASMTRPTVAAIAVVAGDPDRVRAGLRGAEAAGVLELRHDGVTFTHPLLAAAVYQSAARADRRSLHAQLADFVADPEERAWHLALAANGHDEAAANALVAAAVLAARRGAPDSALALLTEAIALTDPKLVEDLAQRQIEAARCLLALDRLRDALALAESVAASPVSDELRSAALEISSYAAIEIRGPEDAARLAAEAMALTTDPRRAMEIGERYGDLLWPLGRQAETADVLGWVLRQARTTRDPALIVRATVSRLADDFVAGRRSASSSLRAIERAIASVPAEPFPWRVHAMRAQISQWADDPAGAQASWRALIEHAKATGNELGRFEFLGYSADLYVRTGQWELAERASREGAAQESDAPLLASHHRCVLALVAAARGDVELARATAAKALALAGEYPWLRARGLAALGLAEIVLGNHRAAAKLMDRAAAADPNLLLRRHGAQFVAVDLIEAAAQAGDLEVAEAALARLEAQAATWGERWVRAVAARSRAVVIAGRGELAAAAESAEAAVALHERLPYPLELGRSLLWAGSLHRRMRHRREARTVLQRAERHFAELGAARWLERARDELGRIGGRAPSPDALTSSERAVADLVARGLSNAEVARELVLTVRTVESHLTRIYAKRGVRTRTELAREVLVEKGGA